MSCPTCKGKSVPKGPKPYAWCSDCKRDLAEPDKRTLAQNRALHKWFDELADELNNRGLDMKTVLKPEVEIPWSGDMVKEHLWRPIQELKCGSKSTTDLSTKEVNEVYEVIDRHLLTKFEVNMPFPSYDSYFEGDS